MYRHLWRTRTFWRAASLSAVPFAAAHLPLFWLLDAAAALLALAMAIGWVALGIGAPWALFLLRDRNERASLARVDA